MRERNTKINKAHYNRIKVQSSFYRQTTASAANAEYDTICYLIKYNSSLPSTEPFLTRKEKTETKWQVKYCLVCIKLTYLSINWSGLVSLIEKNHFYYFLFQIITSFNFIWCNTLGPGKETFSQKKRFLYSGPRKVLLCWASRILIHILRTSLTTHVIKGTKNFEYKKILNR